MANNYKECIKVLNALHTDYPSFSLARHISTATSEYGDIWGMTDKELLYSLNKYMVELEVDSTHIMNDEYVDKVMKDALNLNTLLFEDEEEED